MRKFNHIIFCLFFLLAQNSAPVYAQTQPVQPYIVTTQINHQPVDQEACSILLKNTPNTSEELTASQTGSRMEAGENRLAEINERFQAINEEIAFIERESPDSIFQATAQLEELIEKLYEEYILADEAFSILTADEQVSLISQEPVVLEWQTYIEVLNQMVNELVNERVTLEAEYQELTYQSSLLESERAAEESSQAQLNQCELYAYSAQIMSPEQIMVNQENGSLSQYLVAVDQYLQKLVPLAYQKVSFDDIYHLYNRQLTEEQVALILNGKENMMVDSVALESYSYAKELSLFDVELMASMALWQLNSQKIPQAYQDSYQTLLSLKEKQLTYFYDLNAAVFEKIKSDLAAYLNQHYHVDDDAVHQMQTLHQRYQMKLVLYDPVTISWAPVTGAQSAYIASYTDLELTPIDESEASSNDLQVEDELTEETTEEKIVDEYLEAESAAYLMPPIIEDETTSEDESTSILDSANEDLDTTDNLAYLKEKLAQKNPASKELTVDTLTKPSDSSLSAGLKDETNLEDAADIEKDKPKLPSTGEQRFYMWIAGGLMLVGLALLAFNRYLKYRQRQQAEPVELD